MALGGLEPIIPDYSTVRMAGPARPISCEEFQRLLAADLSDEAVRSSATDWVNHTLSCNKCSITNARKDEKGSD